jgi:EamA-like transporter family
MVAAVLSFTVLDAVAKYLTKSYPVPFVVWARYSAHCLLMLIIFAPKMGRKLFETKRPKVQLLRGLSLIGSTLFFFSALSVLPLADAQSVALLAPIFVTLAAVKWLGEPLPKQTWWVLIARDAPNKSRLARHGNAGGDARRESQVRLDACLVICNDAACPQSHAPAGSAKTGVLVTPTHWA